MPLDIFTLYLVAALIGALLGGLLIFLGRRERLRALPWWGVAYLLGAASISIWTLANPLLGPITAGALNAAGLVACGLVWGAARIFHGRAPSWPGMVAGAVAWCAVAVLAGAEGAALRITFGVAVIASYASLTAWELGTDRRKTFRKRWLAFAVPMLHGFVLILPIAIGDLLYAETFGGGELWITVFAVELVLYAVGTVFIIFMLVSERTVRAHKVAAASDPLTGLLNRRGFSEATLLMIAREAKAKQPVSVMIFDIDHFKSINDRFGHPTGDEVLKMFADVMVNALRVTDLTGRIGGEEFCAMLPCALDEAMIAAERVRKAFAESGVAIDDEPIETTVSIGVASGPLRTALDDLLASADVALYQAKRGGRNRVVAATELLAAENSARKPLAEENKPRPRNVVRGHPAAKAAGPDVDMRANGA